MRLWQLLADLGKKGGLFGQWYWNVSLWDEMENSLLPSANPRSQSFSSRLCLLEGQYGRVRNKELVKRRVAKLWMTAVGPGDGGSRL